MRKSLISLHTCTAISLMISTPLLAQDKTTLTLEEVIVTAQKRSENSQDVPISIQAFGQESINKLGATALFDLTKSAPSLNTGGVPGSNQTSGLRGIVDYGRNIGIDARMGVYIDGVYQGRSSTNNQPLVGLESVEILRGPQGTLFGKNTVSGAINLNTKKAMDTFEGELKIGLGNEGIKQGSVYLNGPISSNVFGSISYSSQQRDGWFKNTVSNSNVGDFDQEGARAQLRFVPSDKLEVIVAADMGSTESDMPVYTVATDTPFTTGKAPEMDTVDFWGSALTVNYTTDSDYTISSISAYRENEYILIGDEDFSAAAAAMQTSFDEDADQFSQEFRLISPQNDVYDWVAGLYFFDSTVATSRNITFGPPILPAAALGGNIAIPSSIDVTSYAAYLHGNYRFTNDLELTFGIRFTDEEKEFDFNQVNSPADSATAAFILENVLGMPAATAAYVASQTPGSLFGAFNLNYSDTYSDSNWSPTVGLNYHANEDTMYYAKYSRGYQSGGFNGDFNPYLPAIQFNSEYVDAFELGIKSTSSDGKIRANANVFIQNYSDFQLFQRVPVNGSSVQIVSNAGEATSQGVEIESTWLVSDQFEITANVTWLDATYDKFENPIAAIDPSQPANYNGNKLNNAPDFSGYIGAQYLIPLASGASLTMNVDYSYRGDSFSNASNNPVKEYIPSYDLINTRLTYVPADNAWEASAWVQNLADDTYITNRSTASITNVDRVIYGTPRTMGIEFRYFLGN